MKPEIIKFRIEKLFGKFTHKIDIKRDASAVNESRVIILTGRNGIGKTTIVNMIAGMLNLDFDWFRRVPFIKGELTLSGNHSLSVEYNEEYLLVKFDGLEAKLNKEETGPATKQDIQDVEILRHAANPILKEVSFEVVDIHRSVALRHVRRREAVSHLIESENIIISKKMIKGKLEKQKNEKQLSQKVKHFIKEAQVDYRKYFSSEGPELFPRIIKRLRNPEPVKTKISDLIIRLSEIKSSESEMSRFGLTMNISDINQLSELLATDEHKTQNPAAIAALEAYVETLESKHQERELISNRLKKFEEIVDDFFIGKKFSIDYEKGFRIATNDNVEINEYHLSSGEYHLLYMMVTALVSTRSGTTIAIDEPELSLHVGWQRKLIKSLSECASGASPIFIFATHSPAIGSEFYDKWVRLTEND